MKYLNLFKFLNLNILQKSNISESMNQNLDTIDSEPNNYNTLLEDIKASNMVLEGWCSLDKAYRISEIIIEKKCKDILEIGIFGGRSLIPMALSIRYLGEGQVIGVDPWSNSEAVAIQTNEINDQWWSKIDFNLIKRKYFESLIHFDLFKYVKTLEINSNQALYVLKNHCFDLIHIDGAHSEEIAYNDVTMWFNNLKPKGIFIIDDICWPSVEKAHNWVLKKCSVLYETKEDGNSYGIYMK